MLFFAISWHFIYAKQGQIAMLAKQNSCNNFAESGKNMYFIKTQLLLEYKTAVSALKINYYKWKKKVLECINILLFGQVKF